MKKFLFTLALCALASLAQAQVRQSGTVTQGHAAKWITNGVIGDGGTAASGGFTSLGTTGQGPTICANSAVNTGPYNQLCLGASTAANAQIALQNYGGAAAQGIDFVINGVVVSIPATGAGTLATVTTPVTIAHIPCFSNTAGNLIDCGITAGGGTITGGIWQGTPIALTFGGTGASSAGDARTNLGLGTMSTQNANAVAITGGMVTGMPNPTVGSDVANKTYVDAAAQGLNPLASSRLATAAVLPNTPTYSNGASGVGATLTAGTNTTLTVDGTVAALSDVVLVKNQASAFQNGIYTVTTAGSGAAAWVLTRATYFDTAAEMIKGSYTFVTAGSANSNSSYILLATVTTVGTDAADFSLYSTQNISLNSGDILVGSSGNIAAGVTMSGNCTIVAAGAITCSTTSITNTSSGTGAVARTVQSKLGDVVNARDFGVTCDGSTDDLVNMNKGIVYANSINATLNLPSGTCIVSGALTTLTGAASLRGQGPRATVIATSSATATIISHSGLGGSIYNLGTDTCLNPPTCSSTTKTAGYHVEITGTGITLEHFWSKHAWVGLRNTGRINRLSDVNIEGMTARSTAANSGGILNDGGILNISQTSVSGSPNITGPTVPAFCYKGIGGVNSGEYDIVNSYGFLCDIGLHIVTTASFGFNGINVSNSWLDSMGSYAVLLDTTPGAFIAPQYFSNIWMGVGISGSTPISGFRQTGPSVGDTTITNSSIHNFLNAGGSGIQIATTAAARSTYISNTRIGGVGTGWSAGIAVSDGNTDWGVVGGSVRGNSVGILVLGTNDNFVITGVNVTSNTTACNNASNAATGFKGKGTNPGGDGVNC